MPSLWVTHTGAIMFCSCLHSMSALNFRCDINMFFAQSNYLDRLIFSTYVWKLFCTHLPSHSSMLPFPLPSVPHCVLLFLPHHPLPAVFTSLPPPILLYPPSPSPPLLPQSFLPAACQLLTPALIVNRLLSQGRDLQESKMSGHGRSSQWHDTQRTVCGHAKINLTSIHHLTLSVWGFGDTLAV